MLDLEQQRQKYKPAGPDRKRLAAELKRRYKTGETLRDLVEYSGRSYGLVRKLLVESGVTLRGRGGVNRKAAT